MPEEKQIIISGLNYPGKKIIDKVVTYYVENNIVYVNGKKFFSDIKVDLTGKKPRFFDENGEFDNFHNSVEKFIQHLFSDKYYKFKGNTFVNSFKCYL
jgi:hypothetical protein